MIEPEHLPRLTRALPPLQRADPPLIREFAQAARLARIPAGQDVFVEGDAVESIAFVISGVVRVYKIGETGREITLYRFGLGESCVLTANAILSRQSFPAIATVEQAAEVVLVPAEVFRDWVRRSDAWRDFVFELLSQRLASLMAVVNEVAFRRLDVRLAAFLLARSRQANPVRLTHQAIAAELGSSREVISRVLEDLAQEGLVQPARGQITVLDPAALETRARM